MIILEPHQVKGKNDIIRLLKEYGLAYVFGAPRIGKTLTALSAIKELGYKKILIVTKKIAMPSIVKDAKALNMDITCINYESVSKVGTDFDMVVLDEAQRLKSFPKAGKGTKEVYEITRKGSAIIYLSATPAIESGSGLYYQFNASVNSPFREWKSFYKWVKAGFVFPVQKRIPTGFIIDYSNANLHLINQFCNHLIIKITQEDAGFKTILDIIDHTIEVPEIIEQLTKAVIKDGIVEGETTEIVADSAVKKLNKAHQLVGGTIITEDGIGRIISDYRAVHIKDNFTGKKIAIFYAYRAERVMLLETLDNIVETPEEFNSIKNSIFIGQVKSASEGVNLSSAEYLIFMNIMYSGTAYVQALDRASYKNRKIPPKVIFLLSPSGIDRKILNSVRKKETYNSQLFRKQYGV